MSRSRITKGLRDGKGTSIPEGRVAAAAGTSMFAGLNVQSFQMNGWFGPGQSLPPVAPKEEAGRAFDYPVAYNVNVRPRHSEPVTFETLRNLADGYDLLRLIIETRKDQIEAYEWELKPKKGKKVSDQKIEEATRFLEFPDQEHNWNTWLRMLLEEVFVIDAAVIYPRKTVGGALYGLELLDGATVKRCLDHTGRTPIPPDPAYQQVLHGLPAIDYTRQELIYWMRNPRVSRVYGFSPVEQIIMTVHIALRRQLHQLQFYTEGSVPEAIAGVPADWTTDDVAKWQRYWDNVMEGNTAQRRHMKFVPFDPSKMAFPKQEVVKDAFDEWLARICCFAFSISPTMLVKETNRATADVVAETAQKEGIAPLLTWVKRLMDHLLQRVMELPDLEFGWTRAKDLDPLTQAKVDEIYLRAKVLAPSEVRDGIGKEPLSDEQKTELAPQTTSPGAVPGNEVPPGGGSNLPTRDTYQQLIESFGNA